jgi:hypothetical protein
MLPRCQNPGVYIGDFNAHSTEWGYSSEDEDGERLVNWSQINRTFLIYDAKQGGTFDSGGWGTTTSPDLCFATSDETGQPLVTTHIILNKFPKSQHRPVVLDIGITYPRIKKPELPRWNLREANLIKF